MFFSSIRMVCSKEGIVMMRNKCYSMGKKLKLDTVHLSYATFESPSDGICAPPLLVMHGLLGSKTNWNSLCKAMHHKTSPQRKIISVDARNHGDSPHSPDHTYGHLAEDIKVLLDRLNIDKVSLLGHSMGGRAVMMFALKYPEIVDKLLVADISPVTTSPSLYSLPALFNIINTITLPRDISFSSSRINVDSQLSTHIGNKGLRSFLLTNLEQKEDGTCAWRMNLQALATNFVNNIAIFPDTADLKFNGPVLFIGGGSSDYIQRTDYPLILEKFPKAELQFIEGAGHWLHSEKPNEFLQISVEFLNRYHDGT